MTTAVDHLVVAAASLDDGVRWCERTLGVTPGPGGVHPLMGTHNRLLNLSGPAFPRCYLEIIAIDPEAPAPARPRWFGIDALPLALAEGPRLIHVVARSTMLDMHRWGLIQKGFNPGVPIAASRGELRWQIVVRDDGRLEAGGLLPTLIQWGERHPTDAMPAGGLVLQSLRLDGLSAAARDVLRLPGVAVAPGASPAIVATLATPKGPIELRS